MSALTVHPIDRDGQPVGVVWLLYTQHSVRAVLRVGARVAEASAPLWLTPGLGETRALQQAAEALPVTISDTPAEAAASLAIVRLRQALRPPAHADDARPAHRWRKGWAGYLRAAGFNVWREF